MDAPPQQQPPPDCLICFGPIRRKIPLWQQPTPIPCDCRPLLHRACWDAWAAQAGPICIICRSNKFYPAPPLHHPVQVRHRLLFFLPADRDPCTSAIVLFFAFYLLLTAYHIFQQNAAQQRITDPPYQREWYPPRRLEL